MNRTLFTSVRQLLALVRASLWQQPVDEEAFLSDAADWNMIGRLAMEQTVGGLAFEAAMSLPDALLPPKEWVHKAFAFVETNRRTYHHVNKCAAEAVKRLREEGIDSVLMKGQAYAGVYPGPELRQCGDIDLYVGEENFFLAYHAVNGFGWECKDEFNPEEKHYGFNLHGVKIELHKVAAKLMPRSVNQKFRRWSHNQILSSGRTISINNEEIPIPTPLFDIIFAFLHLYHHFLNGGIGLRHICDWSMLLHTHSKDINPDELTHLLDTFRLMKAWKKFAPVPVLCLGLPENECPLYSKKNDRHAERIFSAILEEGNFGRAKSPGIKRPEGYLAGKMHSARVVSGRFLTKFRFDPMRIMRYFCSFIVGGTSRVIRDMKKGAGK